MPARHVGWLGNLPLVHETPDLILVHAGIRPGVPVDRQDADDLRWIRGPFLEDRTDHGRLVIHGHTVVPAAEHHGNRVNLDSGAGYDGPLSVAVIEGRQVWLLTPDGRQALMPPVPPA